MKVVIKNGIKLIGIDQLMKDGLAEFSVIMKDDVIVPQKITLEPEDMFKVLDIIDYYIPSGLISLDMYDSGRFVLVLKK